MCRVEKGKVCGNEGRVGRGEWWRGDRREERGLVYREQEKIGEGKNGMGRVVVRD